MKFALGDTVRLLHSGEEGVIVEIPGDGMVKVEVDGTVFPVFEDQLEYPYFARFVEMRKAKKKKKKVEGFDIPQEKKKPVNRKNSGMLLSVLPVYDTSEEKVVSALKLYLANETDDSFTFQCREYLNNDLTFEVKSEVHSFSQVYLKDFPFDHLNDRPRFEFVFTPEEITPAQEPSFTFTLKLKAKQVVKKITELDHQQNALFSYTLFKKYPLIEQKKGDQWELPDRSSSIKYYQLSNRPVESVFQYELDLHIEKLTNDFRGMSATDMLLLQMAALQNALDKAIAHRQHTMVVIHGIGKGVLKREVHEILKQTPEVKRFVNQHDFRYGFGATEIFFEYNT